MTQWSEGDARLYMVVVTALMYRMPAEHEDDRLSRGEHVLSADWTVAFSRSLDALVMILQSLLRPVSAMLVLFADGPDDELTIAMQTVL